MISTHPFHLSVDPAFTIPFPPPPASILRPSGGTLLPHPVAHRPVARPLRRRPPCPSRLGRPIVDAEPVPVVLPCDVEGDICVRQIGMMIVGSLIDRLVLLLR